MKILWKEKERPTYGGKINQLIALRSLGAQVPLGLILSSDQVMIWLEEVLAGLLTHENLLGLAYSEVKEALAQADLPLDWQQQIEAFFQEGICYIVRSSGLMEDQAAMSFAGQYDSVGDCRTLADIQAAVKDCILSLFNPEAQAYWARQQLSRSDLGLALLIQEQIQADYSGVCFSMDLQANQDRTLMLEYVAGGAEALVSGWVNPVQLRLDWYEPDWETCRDSPLSLTAIQQLHKQILNIAAHFGRPVDVEWCLAGEELYLVQARPITTIPTLVETGRWTTANFRDGGVAAQPCPALMWSLYRDSWQQALSGFLKTIGLAPVGPMPPLMRLQFARPYWNLGVVKQGMEQIPGYIERDFDDELGVHRDYDGLGFQTRLTPTLLLAFLQVAFKTQRVTKQFLQTAPAKLRQLRQQFEELNAAIVDIEPIASLQELEELWRRVVEDSYLESETTYFWQAYINTVQLSMKKTSLLKWLSMDQFFALIAGLETVSHTRPLRAMMELAQIILADSRLTEDWQSLPLAQLQAVLEAEPDRIDAQKIQDFQEKFGYHSKRELDLRIPSYGEDVTQVIAAVRALVQDSQAYETVEQSLGSVRSELDLTHFSRFRQRKIKKINQSLQKLLWWREEFKDISTRYYHLIRQISLKLAQAYQEVGYLSDAQDIF